MTLHRALSLVGSVVAFILAREGQYPALYARSRGVEAFPGIRQRIDAIVDRFGNIRDNASPALLEIRRAIREREGQAAKRLQAVLAAAKGRYRRCRRPDIDPRREGRDPGCRGQ